MEVGLLQTSTISYGFLHWMVGLEVGRKGEGEDGRMVRAEPGEEEDGRMVRAEPGEEEDGRMVRAEPG